ncbi:MAG: DUF5103 domain-containing protein [Flavobacterium sp.]|nr:DUF5103 domain-containing protein [Candidatus Neoflavobacterium equi]
MKKIHILILLLLTVGFTYGQQMKEVTPPFNIKTVAFNQGGYNVVPIFKTGDSFQLTFDDLYGNEADYYYTITHCDYNWNPSNLIKQEYLQGMDDLRIKDYVNSFNALQLYSHYKLQIPNENSRILISGNYLLQVLNSSREVVFSRKFIMYDNQVNVPLQIKRSRDISTIEKMQNLEFSVKMGDLLLQNPVSNVKVSLIQNGKLNQAIQNIKPQFTIGNDLIYKYNKETQFYGGNEFFNFDNNNIRGTSNSVAKITSGDLYNTILHTNQSNPEGIYTYFPDVNGNFYVRNINGENPNIEADYSWVYFTLDRPNSLGNNDIYVTGMFNNYALTEENKMIYNKDRRLFEAALLIKQGFTNFEYTLLNKKGGIDYENAINGNHYQTENLYTVLVYYKGNNDRYYKVIGKGEANSQNIVN